MYMLASFFLPSHLSLKHVYMLHAHTIIVYIIIVLEKFMRSCVGAVLQYHAETPSSRLPGAPSRSQTTTTWVREASRRRGRREVAWPLSLARKRLSTPTPIRSWLHSTWRSAFNLEGSRWVCACYHTVFCMESVCMLSHGLP